MHCNMAKDSPFWWGITGVNGCIAVLMGAVAAHWLSGVVEPEDIARVEKAAMYQMYHTLALLALLMWPRHEGKIKYTRWAFLMGILLFSGSLYLYSFTHLKLLVYVTPLGGMAFLLGWGVLALCALRRSPS